MKLQLQSNCWSCLPTAFAMVLNQPLETIIKMIGHDGSKIVWPTLLKDPYRRQSFHIQELVLVAHDLGYSSTLFQALPSSLPEHNNECSMHEVGHCDCGVYLCVPQAVNYDFERILDGNPGVLIGIGTQNLGHAVAWDGINIFDPSNELKSIEEFQIKEFWLIKKMF